MEDEVDTVDKKNKMFLILHFVHLIHIVHFVHDYFKNVTVNSGIPGNLKFVGFCDTFSTG
jgi:hypothetical protein